MNAGEIDKKFGRVWEIHSLACGYAATRRVFVSDDLVKRGWLNLVVGRGLGQLAGCLEGQARLEYTPSLHSTGGR
jgi:hypothetical protein